MPPTGSVQSRPVHRGRKQPSGHQGWGGGTSGDWLAFCGDENVLEQDGGDGHNFVNTLKAPELCT